jgi:apolipoprotein D and lipocalin family protein
MPRLMVLFLALAACAAKEPPPASLRDTGKPMYSTAGFSAGRLLGEWVQVGEVTRHPGCGPGRLSVTVQGTEAVVDWRLCLDGRLEGGHGNLVSKGDGRFAVPGSDLPWWVLWADADGRTMVLGTPSGAFGIVLDRAKIPADRAKAAADILAWNGYDMGLLQLP